MSLFFVIISACATPTEVGEQAFEHYSKKGHGNPTNARDSVSNPVKADKRSLENGKLLFNKYCATCHGKTGEGDGANAAKLPNRPADLARLSTTKSDYSIYLQISYGGSDMPTWMKEISADSRWDIVNYVRSLSVRN